MRKKRTIIQKDAETGEVLDGVAFYVSPKKYNGFGKEWFAMGQSSEALDVLIDDFERLEDVKVFFVLLKHLDYENHITVKQIDVARRLGILPSNVSRSIRRLLGMGAIFKGSKPGYPYQLNPNFGWKGSAKNHVLALDEHRNKRRKAAQGSEIAESSKPEEEK